MRSHSIAVSSPGRICLFGEHQDYLGLPVIAAAIGLRFHISAVARRDLRFCIRLHDLAQDVEFIGNQRLPYMQARDYFRSGFNVIWDRGFRPPHGWDLSVGSAIPMNAGASSSSALTAAWIKFLLIAAGDSSQDDPGAIARLAYQAEVSEFNEPGGMMDHFATVFGHVIYLDFDRNEVQALQPELGTFVLGDSKQPKDTMGILAALRTTAQEAMTMMRGLHPDFDLRTTPQKEIQPYYAQLPARHAEVLRANMIDRDLLQKARQVLAQSPMNHEHLGALLTEHHEQLSRRKRVSTPKIDRMLEAALQAGALGGKINGSGGGGCMFAYAPGNAEAVAEALAAVGGMPYVLEIDEGTRRENELELKRKGNGV